MDPDKQLQQADTFRRTDCAYFGTHSDAVRDQHPGDIRIFRQELPAGRPDGQDHAWTRSDGDGEPSGFDGTNPDERRYVQ